MPSDKSGGARAVEKKHEEREARRRRGRFDEKAWRKRYEALPMPAALEDRFEWAANVAALAIAEAAADPGPPPEQRREQIVRAVAQLAKVLPSAELAAKLRRYKTAMEELKKPRHGASVDPRADGGTRPPATLS